MEALQISNTPQLPVKCRSCDIAGELFGHCMSLAARCIEASQAQAAPDVRTRHVAAVAALLDMRRRCPGQSMDGRCLWQQAAPS